MDNKPPPRAWQWSTFSHSVCFLDLTTLLLIRFRHLYQFPFPFNQTMVQVTVQPLYSMASSIAHDLFLQEANPLHSLCVLKSSRAWRHSDLTHVPLVTRLYSRCSLKKVIFFTVKLVCVCSFPHVWDPGSRDANPALWLVERGHVNKWMSYPMLMSHVTVSNNRFYCLCCALIGWDLQGTYWLLTESMNYLCTLSA